LLIQGITFLSQKQLIQDKNHKKVGHPLDHDSSDTLDSRRKPILTRSAGVGRIRRCSALNQTYLKKLRSPTMGNQAWRLALAAALLWIGFGVGGRAEAAGIALQTPPGLSPGDHFRFIFVVTDGTTATSANIADYNSFVNTHAGGLHTTARRSRGTPSHRCPRSTRSTTSDKPPTPCTWSTASWSPPPRPQGVVIGRAPPAARRRHHGGIVRRGRSTVDRVRHDRSRHSLFPLGL
jgi:hypothetical protein